MHHNYKLLSAVLLDIMMPVMDGYEFLRQTRDNIALSQIPVIIVTGSDDENARVKALSLGANDFVTKPYNPDIIKHCLRNNISLRETASIVNAMQKDKLTGLYNRETFFEKVTAIVKDSEPGYYMLSCFDVDSFKLINDKYGAEEGDRILREIGRVVKKDMDNIGGIAGRISADNFAVLLPVKHKELSITRFVQMDRMAFSEQQAIIFSVGRYVVTDLTLPASAIYDRAYIAKQSVKGRYDEHIAYFDEPMLDKLMRDQHIIADMDAAIKERQFEIYFQPQYNHATGALIGAEALARWLHPKKGLIQPSEFISVFERNGFIYELDKYVWEEACRYLRKWMDEGRSPLPVSVNVSRYDIFRADLVDILTGLIKKYDIPADFLRLEITESAFAKSTKQIVSVVKQLINNGFTIEIDDFGSGYSSLNTLKSVPAQVIKLDIRFLEDDDDSQRGGNILESIVRMTKWLGMSIIAEGVEDRQQADFLKSIGCSYIQGYLYARPMPAQSYEAHCLGVGKEEKLLTLETVANLDNNSFWDPKSMDTLIFNSYVGGACIYEYHNGRIELMRATDKYAQIIGSAGMTVEDALKLDWSKHLDQKTIENVTNALKTSIDTKDEVIGEYLFLDLPGCPHETYLRSSMRVIAHAEDRYLVYCINENITAQRQAEQKERVAAAQLAAIMNNVNGGVTAVNIEDDDNIRYFFSNDEYYAMQGYTREQFADEVKDSFDLVHPDDRAAMKAWVKKLIRNRGSGSFDYRIIKRNGEVIFVRSTCSVTCIEGIGDNVLLSVMTNMSELVEAERRATRIATQLQIIMDNINSGITAAILKKAEPVLLFSNNQFYKQLGYTKEQYDAEVANPQDLIHPDDRERIEAETRDASRSGSSFSLSYRIIRRDGSIRWLQSNVSITTIPGMDGLVQLAVANDVTQQQEAIERLRISEEENRLATIHTGNTVCRYNLSDRSLTIPPKVNPIFDMPPKMENVPYQPVESGNISPETADAYIAFYESILNGQESGSAIYQRKSTQGWRWIEAHFSTIFSSANKPTSAVVSFTDITEQIEKETIYKKWQQSLESHDPETFTLFRSNISKNTSFDTMVGSLLSIKFSEDTQTFDQRTMEIAERYVFDEDKEPYITFLDSDTLLANYYRGKRADTLEFREKLSDGGVRWLRLTVELVEYPNSADVEAYMMYENIDNSKRAELLAIQRAENDPLTGVLNRTAFKARVEHLIKIAKPHMQHALLMIDIDGFKMVNDVFGHAAGDQALVEIADSLRSSLRKEDLIGRLGGDEFLIFLNDIPSNAVAANKARQICALIRKSFSIEVEISGSIGIAMYPGDGVGFEALYKKADASLYHVKGSIKDSYAFYHEDMENEDFKLNNSTVVPVKPQSAKKKRRILIVEDSKIDYEILANIFAGEFVIERAADGNAALIRLRHYGSAISVVLLDLLMPGMDGFAVLEKMQQNAELRSIPVIVVSSSEDRDTSLRAIKAGASDFINKPIDPDVIRIRVDSAISKAENERLRAKNSLLEYQNSEVIRYKTILERLGVAVIEHDWVSGDFSYDSSISERIAGVYDNRKLWRILLSDMVADTLTVKQMQEFIHSIAEDKTRHDGSMTVMLETPSNGKRKFRMNVHKLVNEYQLTDKLLLAFREIDP